MSSVLTPNYPPPARKTKEEMIEEAKSSAKGSSFMTPNYPPPARKSKEELIAEAQSSRKSAAEGEEKLEASPPPPMDYKGCGIAMVVMVIIFGVIIGVLVGTNNNLDTTDPAPAPAPAPSNSTSTTSSTVDSTCELVMKNFTADNLVLTMSVSPEISALEIDYASTVFEKTYEGILKNELSAAADAYCDPYCRDITEISVVSNTLTVPDEPAAAEARQAGEDCAGTLDLTFEIKGTFVGCEDTEYPGLFASGRRQLVQVQRSQVRFDMTRALEGHTMMETEEMEVTCPSCDDSTLGLASPTLDGVKTLVSDFVTVLPAICEVTGAEIVPSERL
mmetsp:Transcript_56846/g.138384  ORF Transcript_56846/g.138384 Transcript_56846/m.138384 type:complete len:333 (-) Transcript_56846:2578-3576(-)